MHKETVRAEVSNGFVHILHDRENSAIGQRQMWFRVENLPWIIEKWAACTEPYCEEVNAARMDDSFTVAQIGREGAWRLLMQNERAEGTPHAGIYSFSATLTCGEELLRQLRELAKSQGL